MGDRAARPQPGRPAAEVCVGLARAKVIAMVRAQHHDAALKAAMAAVEGGMRAVVVPAALPKADTVVAQLRRLDDVWVGAGGVVNQEAAQPVLEAGADLVLLPTLDEELLRLGHRAGIAVAVGAATPTESARAWTAEADLVNCYPAGFLGGPPLIRELRECLPYAKWLVSGGIDPKAVSDYLRSGAVAVGVSEGLFAQDWLQKGQFDRIVEQAKRLVEVVQDVKSDYA